MYPVRLLPMFPVVQGIIPPDPSMGAHGADGVRGKCGDGRVEDCGALERLAALPHGRFARERQRWTWIVDK